MRVTSTVIDRGFGAPARSPAASPCSPPAARRSASSAWTRPAVQRELTRSILTSDTLSTPTRNALFQHDLVQRWEDDPRGAIAALHDGGRAGRRATRRCLRPGRAVVRPRRGRRTIPRITALQRSTRGCSSSRRTSSARSIAFDPRTRIAADLYNRGLAQGFASRPRRRLPAARGQLRCPFGYLDVYFDATQLERGNAG